ncbi:MAG: MaoC family dehydratase N-terminal domain-containing protein [Chloroflexi bacterium]|nr:MaoC family dehydratase N-terminal domain-containing protein [Chloroflexota bacterium]
MSETYITDEMRATIGQESAPRVAAPVDRSLIRIWAIAYRWPEPPDRLYWDDEFAKTTKYGGVIAPPYFNPFAYHIDETRMEGPQTFGELSIEPGTRPLNGGGESEYFDIPIRPGDVISETNKVVDIYEREGRLGRMMFTVTETYWRNQRGELVRIYRGTGIRY